MAEQTIELTISRSEAEVLLGVLAAERYDEEAQAVCDAVREQIDAKLRPAEAPGGRPRALSRPRASASPSRLRAPSSRRSSRRPRSAAGRRSRRSAPRRRPRRRPGRRRCGGRRAPSTIVQTRRRLSSSRSISTSRATAPLKNVTSLSSPSSSVSTTKPGTSRWCTAPQSRSASQTSSGEASIFLSLRIEARRPACQLRPPRVIGEDGLTGLVVDDRDRDGGT